MKKSILKKVHAITLASVVTVTSAPVLMAETTNIVSEATNAILNELSQPKENYEFLEGEVGSQHLVYTYESNNINYKVVEDFAEDYSTLSSIIYKQDVDGEFVEYPTQTLNWRDSSTLETQVTVDGETITLVDKVQAVSKADTADHDDYLGYTHDDVYLAGYEE